METSRDEDHLLISLGLAEYHDDMRLHIGDTATAWAWER